MLTQTEGAHTLPARNPRRRGRRDVEDTASLRIQPARKKSKTSANGAATAPFETQLTNGHAPSHGSYSLPARHRSDLHHSSPIDVLAENENFTIGELPALPRELRTSQEDYRGYLEPTSHLALALTKTTAYVWIYSSNSPSPTTKSVRLTHPTRADEPLSLGSLVHTGSPNEVGLLVIHPRSGKITYWENIDNADALSLFAHRRTGTEGSLSLYSGETAVSIEDAHFAGFVVTTSSDRVAQVQLRDSQSRPSVNVQYLPAPKRQASGGLFGGILNAFGGSGLMRDIVATRIQQSSSRNSVLLLIASEHGQYQQWQLGWAEAPVLVSEWNAQEQMQAAIPQQLKKGLPSAVQETRLLDFTHVSAQDRGNSMAIDGQRRPVTLFSLYSVSGASFKTYALGTITLTNDGSCTYGELLHLNSFSAPLYSGSRWKPKLCVPETSLTAFVFFDKAIVTASLASMVADGEAQDQSAVFQDTTYLKDDEIIVTVGATAESYDPQRHQSSATALIRGTGLVRITAFEPRDQDEAVTGNRVSVKSKIEQAVLYGGKPRNPLDLSRKPELALDRDEVETAVTQISTGILRSSYPILDRDHASTDQQISQRQRVLESLARHVKDNYTGLSRPTKWQLLWDGEKLAVARVLNAISNQHSQEIGLPDVPVGRKMLLPELIEHIPEGLRTADGADWGSFDQFSRFIFKDVDKLSHALSWIYNAVFSLAQQEDVRESEALLWLIRDATQIVCQIIETAFSFRTDNLWLYDLEKETLEDGIMVPPSSYEGLPAPWTSHSPNATKVYALAENAQTAITDEENRDREVPEVTKYIASENPRLIALWCRLAKESTYWATAQQEETEATKEGRGYHDGFDEALSSLLKEVNVIDETVAGMTIAEKYGQMPALTKLVREESAALYGIAQACEQPQNGESVQQEIERRQYKEETEERIAALETRIADYCKRYGYTFTEPYYGALVKNHNYAALLQQSMSYKREVTEYLRAEKNRRPLAWINEVIVEKNYETAGQDLSCEALQAERKTWKKSVELGFAKLALLAADENDAIKNAPASAPGQLPEDAAQNTQHWQQDAKAIEQAQTLLDIQAQLWDRVQHITECALDQDSKVELLVEALSKPLQQSPRRHLQALFEQDIEALTTDEALRAEELVDILTLMDVQGLGEDRSESNKDIFCLALLAVQNDTSLSDARRDVLLKTSWRRAMLADPWNKLSKRIAKERLGDEGERQLLSSTVLYKTFLDGFKATIDREEVHDHINGAATGNVNGEFPSPLAYLSDMPTPNPTECLGAGTTADDWIARYGEEKRELAEPLASECQVEEGWLRVAMEKHQLEKWWGVCRSIAMEDARGNA